MRLLSVLAVIGKIIGFTLLGILGLLILILLLAWLEKKDEELLILLSALIVMSL